MMAHLSRIVPAFCLIAVGCVSVNKSVLSRERVGQPVQKEEVQVYFADDSVPAHERIAILNAKGDDALTNEGQMIDKLRAEAGKLGANAIILGEVRDASTAARVAAAVIGTPAMRKRARPLRSSSLPFRSREHRAEPPSPLLNTSRFATAFL